MNIGMIAGAFEGILKGLDGIFTSDEERLNAKGKIISLQSQVMGMSLEYESKLTEAKTSIIVAEAQGKSWIQRNWRPLLMLSIVGIIVNNYILFPYLVLFGIPATPLELPDKLYTLMEIGVGGYVVGRSAEKIASSVNFKPVRAKEKK
jgi:hypothetical protein